MLRLDVEYTEENFKIAKLNESRSEDKKIKRINNIGQMTLDYGFKDTNDFLLSLQTDIKLPKKTRDIYLYLPSRMLGIYPTIELFSNLDLMTGKKWKKHLLIRSTRFIQNSEFIELDNGIKIEKRTLGLVIGKNKVQARRYIKLGYDKNGTLHKEIVDVNKNENLNIIYLENERAFLIVDNSVYNSLYFQMALLENYDKNLFEPVIIIPQVKVYKLKI
jgi:dolichyl-diphosphooligosaccharide--protein glycosyltransferase/undecaprenyl-diphosphooligosaccharide--protein glycosyltransferase